MIVIIFVVDQVDCENLVILMDARLEDEKGLDFSLQGGREFGPIVVCSVSSGMSALQGAPKASPFWYLSFLSG